MVDKETNTDPARPAATHSEPSHGIEPAQPAAVPLRVALRVALVDGDAPLAGRLREDLGQLRPAGVLETYASGSLALTRITLSPPQVVLIEEELPDRCGIEWAARLLSRWPALPVVIHAAQGCPKELFQALKIGAMGYVVKPGVQDWLTHLRDAMDGRFALCEEAQRLLPRVFSKMRETEDLWGLSRREEEVMVCLCQRRSDKEIASALGISDATVHCHLDRIFKKLRVNDRKSAIEKFISQSLGGGGVKGPGAGSEELDLF